MREATDIHDDESELRREAPTLYGTGKKDPFRAPEGYFDTLPERIMERRNSRARRITLANPRLWLPMAAAAAVAGFGIYTGLLRDGIRANLPDAAPYIASAPAVTDDLVDELVHYYDVDDALIAEAMDAASAPGAKGGPAAVTDDEVIIAWLVENDIDLHTIMEEL